MNAITGVRIAGGLTAIGAFIFVSIVILAATAAADRLGSNSTKVGGKPQGLAPALPHGV